MSINTADCTKKKRVNWRDWTSLQTLCVKLLQQDRRAHNINNNLFISKVRDVKVCKITVMSSAVRVHVWGISADELWPEAYELRMFAKDAGKEEGRGRSRKEKKDKDVWKVKGGRTGGREGGEEASRGGGCCQYWDAASNFLPPTSERNGRVK